MEEPANTGNHKITVCHQLAVGQNFVGTMMLSFILNRKAQVSSLRHTEWVFNVNFGLLTKPDPTHLSIPILTKSRYCKLAYGPLGRRKCDRQDVVENLLKGRATVPCHQLIRPYTLISVCF